jgi:hypothetical protein
LEGLEHDPEKWEPIFGKDQAQTKMLEPRSDSIKVDKALGWLPAPASGGEEIKSPVVEIRQFR